jgi:hypothetical protein
MAAPANKELLLYDTSGNMNPDGGSLGAMNDNFGGGGGGGDISGGGGGNPISPRFGCTDPRASNYDASATYNDGSCTYAPTNVYNTQNLVVEIGIQSNPQDGIVLVDGVIQNVKSTPTELTFNQKELLTPKQITLQKSGVESSDVYKVYTLKKENRKQIPVEIPFDDVVGYTFESDPQNPNAVIRKREERPKVYESLVYFTYYQLIVEKLIDGNFIQQNILEASTETDAVLSTTLKFDLKTFPVPIDPLPEAVARIQINGDVYQNDLISYRASNGVTGNVTSGRNEFDLSGGNYIQFTSNGLSSQTHAVVYEVITRGNSVKYDRLDFKLEPGIDNVIVNVSVSKKSNDNIPVADAPTLRTEGISFEFNIAGDNNLNIPYNSVNASEIIYSLGSTQRTLSPNGSIVLSKNDFYNGVGNYVVYLQPRSDRAGSGQTTKITINVVNKYYLPGPDITHINYPQNIKGADFKGFNVDFDISWQSINTNYIEMYVSKYDKQYALGKLSPSGLITLNVEEVLRKAQNQFNEDTDKVQFEILLVPFNAEGDELTEGKIERISILFDKGDLKLRRGSVIADIRSAFEINLDQKILEEEISKFLTHYLHLGDGDNKLIATWGVDTETFSEYKTDAETGNRTKTKEQKSLVLKLYEPLPREIQPNQQLWISKIQSIPIIEQVTIIDELKSECTPLKPNFNVTIGDEIGYQILDDLISSGSNTSTDLINSYVSSSEFSLENLNIQYESGSTYAWSNFVKYSSAEERVKNFLYKVELIEFYNNKINFVSSSLSYASGSVTSSLELQKHVQSKNKVKAGFDGFEKYLFTSSSNGLTYPFFNSSSYSYYNPTSSQVTDWYGGIIDDAQQYDYNNKNILVNNIPAHITNDAENAEFVLFLNMMGQHFDTLWSYTKGIAQSKKLEHKYEDGIGNDLIYHMLESLGWNADMGVQSQYLWEYAFGKNSDGSSSSSMSGKSRQHQVWRRILNNLPYLLKHKGTKRALSAAMACYGVPSSMLTIMEYGGPNDPSSDATTTFTFDDRTCALQFGTGSFLQIPFKDYSDTNGTDFPNAIEFSINTLQSSITQSLLRTDKWKLDLVPGTGSLAKLEFKFTGSNSTQSVSTDYMPFYNDAYTNIVLNRRTGSTTEVFELYLKEGFQGRIRNEVIKISDPLPIGSTTWKSGSILYVGEGLTGALDEFRLWRTPLPESRIDNHTLLPDAIDGSHISASTVDLLFRLDFEYPISTTGSTSVPSGSIKNVSINNGYSNFATASNFTANTTYPYNYIPYERTVTAKVPSSGLTVGNKFRFETQTLSGDLNYKSRVTKKSYDQAPIDTDRLGLFFSPMKEVNMDILRSLGEFNIDDYIGNPADEYNDSYSDLTTLRNYYFQRYDLNTHEYIQLVRYIDKSLFETLESLVPARAKVSSGLLIEPHILERSKVKWNRPTAVNIQHQVTIDTNETTNQFASYQNINAFISTSNAIDLNVTNPQYSVEIQTQGDLNLVATNNSYNGEVDTFSTTNVFGIITTDSTKTMGGIFAPIDATITGSIRGEYDQTEFTQVGLDKNSLSVAGFGLFGSNGNVIRTYRDVWGNFIKERNKVFLIKESYTKKIPENINALDKSLGTELISTTFYRTKVTILDWDGATPTVGGNIVEVTPLNGYFSTHYRNTGDLSTGLQNSYFNGSKQTSTTNILGGSPVQTFTTNPNILKVSDTGRGSGEPILVVD